MEFVVLDGNEIAIYHGKTLTPNTSITLDAYATERFSNMIIFDIDGDISAARHGRAAPISGRVEPRSGDHQREVRSPQQRHDDLALGNLFGLEYFGNPLAMSGRNVAFRFIVSFVRNRVDIRLFSLERQHRALQQRLL